MTKDDLLAKLAEYAESNDEESAHYDADTAIIEYINDPEIAVAYEKIGKWYA